MTPYVCTLLQTSVHMYVRMCLNILPHLHMYILVVCVCASHVHKLKVIFYIHECMYAQIP